MMVFTSEVGESPPFSRQGPGKGKSMLDSRVREIIERVVTQEGYELVHAELTGGRNPFLRIFIDKPEGITADDCARASDRVGLMLDLEDLIPHAYTLEVASPGLDRGLYKPSDYARFAGKRVHIRLSEPIEGQRNFHGTLIGLDEEGETVAVLEDERGIRHRLPLTKILKANVDLEF
jgi:Uncharacterized protein conserved in bacteria